MIDGFEPGLRCDLDSERPDPGPCPDRGLRRHRGPGPAQDRSGPVQPPAAKARLHPESRILCTGRRPWMPASSARASGRPPREYSRIGLDPRAHWDAPGRPDRLPGGRPRGPRPSTSPWPGSLHIPGSLPGRAFLPGRLPGAFRTGRPGAWLGRAWAPRAGTPTMPRPTGA
ncbi:MAG: hypothetical protein M0C28_22715 [Candidatus Moduliflexus flocculans]|nr:hypothetical protein [Candidatus Moduliflexus flocculans]